MQETPPPPDSPAARRRWLLGIGLILAGMIVVPWALERLSTPGPVAVTVDRSGLEGPGSSPLAWDDLTAALDTHPALVSVPWPPSEPDEADVRLEVEGARPAGPVAVRLFPWPDGPPVWEGQVAVDGEGDLAERIATAVAGAVSVSATGG